MRPVSVPLSAPRPPRSGYISAFLVIAIWTGFLLVSRAGGVSALTSWDLIAIRYMTASALLLPVWWVRRSGTILSVKHVVLAGTGGLGYAVLAFAGFKVIPAAHAAVLLPGLQPFAVAIAAWWLLGETPTTWRLASLVVVALGVSCLMVDGLRAGPALLEGDLLMLGASACWACYSTLLRRWNLSPWDATVAVTLLTAAMYLPVYLLWLPKHMDAATWSDIAIQAVYQGLIATIVQMLLYVRTITLIGPTQLGMLMALVPGLAGVAAVPLLGEPLLPWVGTGLLLVSLGAWIGSR